MFFKDPNLTKVLVLGVSATFSLTRPRIDTYILKFERPAGDIDLEDQTPLFPYTGPEEGDWRAADQIGLLDEVNEELANGHVVPLMMYLWGCEAFSGPNGAAHIEYMVKKFSDAKRKRAAEEASAAS
jgi:hypothetical protein